MVEEKWVLFGGQVYSEVWALVAYAGFSLSPLRRLLPVPFRIVMGICLLLLLACQISIIFDPTFNLSMRTRYLSHALMVTGIVFIGFALHSLYEFHFAKSTPKWVVTAAERFAKLIPAPKNP